jgi:SOS response regulatory protein OraA/RecX
MEFKSEEEFRRVAKKAVQILLYVVESKSPLLRKLKAKNFISKIYGANQNGTVYFEVEVPFSVNDPDHGPLCQELDKVLSAVIRHFGDYHLNENMEFVIKTEEGDDMVGFLNSCNPLTVLPILEKANCTTSV